MNIGTINDKSKCCACAACKNICPKQAIDLTPDKNGYLYPNIDFEKCIDCGLCVKVCNYNKAEVKHSKKKHTQLQLLILILFNQHLEVYLLV